MASCIGEKTCGDCGIIHSMSGKPDTYSEDKTHIYCWGPCLCGLFTCKHCGGKLQTPQWKLDEIQQSMKSQKLYISPEAIQEIRNWMPTEEQAREFWNTTLEDYQI